CDGVVICDAVYCRWCLCSRSAHHRGLLSFPTRRSSDLAAPVLDRPVDPGPAAGVERLLPGQVERPHVGPLRRAGLGGEVLPQPRSEEHTSELQSRENLVCRLLLEKKKASSRIILYTSKK